MPPGERRLGITAALWHFMTHVSLLAEYVLWCGVLSPIIPGPQLAAPRVRRRYLACGALGGVPLPFLESSLARLNCFPATSRLPSELLPDYAPSLTEAGRIPPPPGLSASYFSITHRALPRSARAPRSSSQTSGKVAPAKAGSSSKVIGASYAGIKAPSLRARQGPFRYGCSTR